jgi:DNA transposition AAA+ family ATPase
MSKQTAPRDSDRGQAATQTIAVAATGMQTILDRSEGMPGMAALSGPPGLGKTSAAVYLTHPAGFNAVYVSCRSFETTKSLALMLLKELGVAAKTHWPISTAFDHICEALIEGGRPLVVDEVDRIAEKNTIELLRDIHDIARTPLFLIGEEHLRQKLLNHHERFHDRVLVWAKAMPADAADLDKLIRHYTPDVAIDPDAKAHLLQVTHGVARRIVTALNRLREEGRKSGLARLALADVQAVLKGAR